MAHMLYVSARGRWPWLVLMLTMIFGSSVKAAPEDVGELEHIVVVGMKKPHKISDVTGEITLVSKADLDAQHSLTMADVFRYTPGIDYQSGGIRFGTSGVSVRGVGGNRLAMEIDGVPVSEQFDIGRFAHATRDFFDTGTIQHIEVLRGPASALYGSSALAGVMAIRTVSPHDLVRDSGIGGDVFAAWRAQDNSRHSTVRLAVRHGVFGGLIAGSLREGEEHESAGGTVPDQQDYQRKAALLKLTADDVLAGDWVLSVNQQSTDSNSDLRSQLGSGRLRATTRLLGDDRMQMSTAHLQYDFKPALPLLDSGNLHAYTTRSEVAQYTLDERAIAARPVAINRQFDYAQRLRGFEANVFADFDRGEWSNEIAAGMEWNERRTAEQRDGAETGLIDGLTSTTVLGEAFPLRDFPLTTTRELGLFVAGHASRGRLMLSGALRYDHNRLTPRSDTMFAEDNPGVVPVSVDASDVSPKFGLIWHATPDVDFYIQYAHGFRAPPFEDANIGLDIPLFNIRAIPNPELRSESSDGIDAGWRWHTDRTEVTASVFHTRYEDFIATKVRLGTDPLSGLTLFQSQNIERARIKGIEMRLQHRFARALEGFDVDLAAYRATGDNKVDDQPLNSVGPAQATVSVNWSSQDTRTHARLVATIAKRWSRRDTRAGDLFEPPGYALLDVFVSRQFYDGLTLRAGLHNLADRTVWPWSGVAGVSAGDPLISVLALPGRALSVSASWQW